MAKGVQNSRGAQLAASAASQFRMYWKQLCSDAEAMNVNDGSLLRVRATDPSSQSYHDVDADPATGSATNKNADFALAMVYLRDGRSQCRHRLIELLD